MIKEEDVVLCTVKRIEGTTVFVEIEGNGEGTIIFSEVSPGRIRNIREFVVPNKKIVCKVLRMKDGHPQLSLRRVTAGERDEVMDRYKKEKVLENMIKPVLKEKTAQALEKIKEKYELADFLDEAREDPQLIKKFFSNSDSEELMKIFTEKKEKEKEVKKEITLKTNAESGVEDIKHVLDVEANIYYNGSSKFSIITKAKDYKKANSLMERVIEEIRQRAKQHKVTLEIKEK